MSDLLGRDACIAELLLRAGVAAPELCHASTVRTVLTKPSTMHTHWVTVHPQGLAPVTPIISGFHFPRMGSMRGSENVASRAIVQKRRKLVRSACDDAAVAEPVLTAALSLAHHAEAGASAAVR